MLTAMVLLEIDWNFVISLGFTIATIIIAAAIALDDIPRRNF